MSTKMPPLTLMYSMGGGAGSRLESRARCGVPYSTFRHGLLDGGVCGVEAAVETDHERHACGIDCGEGSIDLGEVQADGLLAEDRLAGRGGAFDEVDMGVGARAHGHSVDIGGSEHLLDGHDGGA